MSEELDMIDRAQQAADRLERANKVMEELQKRQAELDARRILGGQSEAGHKEPEMTEEEKVKVGMKQYFKGSAIETMLNRI